MRVLLTGGTGFIGTPVAHALRAAGHDVTIVSRRPGFVPEKAIPWDGVRDAMPETDAVVNLAGTSVADGRWTAERKADIMNSRVDGTRVVVDAIREASKRPTVLVNASAIGWYGARGDEELDESAPAGEGFLAEVCRAWEAAAWPAQDLGVRTVALRIGVVIGRGGGALAKMLIPFRMGLGGPIGNGKQWVSWVHLNDVVGLVLAAVSNEQLTGPVNATAPTPVRNKDLTASLAKAVDRPAFLPVPGFALRLAVGEFADALITGQRVIPAAALAAGYEFKEPDLDAALPPLVF
jgi:uncharacterized protein (TIGR01777 family)